MLFLYPTPAYPRTSAERIIKFFYYLTNLAHLACLVILVTEYILRLDVSVIKFYSNRDLVVAPGVVSVMQNCTYKDVITLQSTHVAVELSIGSISYALMTTIQYLNGLFVLQFLLLVNNTISFLNFSSGNRHLRFFGAHVPFYHINIVFTYLYSIAIIVMTWCFNHNRQFFARALGYCAEQLQQIDYQAYVESEFNNGTIFDISVYWPFVATCFGLIVYLVSAVILCWNSSDKANLLLSEADAPWESRGIRCQVSKPLLRLHTAQRNAIMEDARRAIAEGEKVRIVRSYQLMTEDDFNALVQAMREQVAMLTKESQFEQLRANFGDSDSPIDEQGFLWRHAIPSAPPSPHMGDEFRDVDFDDYFEPPEQEGAPYAIHPHTTYATNHEGNHNNKGAEEEAAEEGEEYMAHAPVAKMNASRSRVSTRTWPTHAADDRPVNNAAITMGEDEAEGKGDHNYTHAADVVREGGAYPRALAAAAVKSSSSSTSATAATANAPPTTQPIHPSASSSSSWQNRARVAADPSAPRGAPVAPAANSAPAWTQEGEEARTALRSWPGGVLEEDDDNNDHRGLYASSHYTHRAKPNLSAPLSGRRLGAERSGGGDDDTHVRSELEKSSSSAGRPTSRRARHGPRRPEAMPRWSPYSPHDERPSPASVFDTRRAEQHPQHHNIGSEHGASRSRINRTRAEDNTRERYERSSSEAAHVERSAASRHGHAERRPHASRDSATVDDHSRPDYLDVRHDHDHNHHHRRHRRSGGEEEGVYESVEEGANGWHSRRHESDHSHTRSRAHHRSSTSPSHHAHQHNHRSSEHSHRHSTREDVNIDADELSEH